VEVDIVVRVGRLRIALAGRRIVRGSEVLRRLNKPAALLGPKRLGGGKELGERRVVLC
jgi:hypothetical protein